MHIIFGPLCLQAEESERKEGREKWIGVAWGDTIRLHGATNPNRKRALNFWDPKLSYEVELKCGIYSRSRGTSLMVAASFQSAGLHETAGQIRYRFEFVGFRVYVFGV